MCVYVCVMPDLARVQLVDHACEALDVREPACVCVCVCVCVCARTGVMCMGADKPALALVLTVISQTGMQEGTGTRLVDLERLCARRKVVAR